jgi:hypothetical protein
LGNPAIKTLIHGTKLGSVGLQITQREGNEKERVAPETSKYVPQKDHYCFLPVGDERCFGVSVGEQLWPNTEPIRLW